MKKITALMIVLIILFCGCASICSAEETVFVFDNANILSEEKEEKMNKSMMSLFEDTKHKVYLVTVNGIDASTMDEAAKISAEKLDLTGIKGAVLILFNLKTDEFGFYAKGDVEAYINETFRANVVRSDAQFFLDADKPGDAAYNVALSTVWRISDGSVWDAEESGDDSLSMLINIGLAMVAVVALILFIWFISLAVKYSMRREISMKESSKVRNGLLRISLLHRRHKHGGSSHRHTHRRHHRSDKSGGKQE